MEAKTTSLASEATVIKFMTNSLLILFWAAFLKSYACVMRSNISKGGIWDQTLSSFSPKGRLDGNDKLIKAKSLLLLSTMKQKFWNCKSFYCFKLNLINLIAKKLMNLFSEEKSSLDPNKLSAHDLDRKDSTQVQIACKSRPEISRNAMKFVCKSIQTN